MKKVILLYSMVLVLLFFLQTKVFAKYEIEMVCEAAIIQIDF